MTTRRFARATGFTEGYIRNACKKGKIPCDTYKGKYDISPTLVSIWAAKRNRHTGKNRNIHNSVTVYQRKLDEYNYNNGTNYSYGVAVSLGVIRDE